MRLIRSDVAPDVELVECSMRVIYPEFAQTDLVEKVAEDETIFEHLQAMFPPNSPPAAWDPQCEYTADSIAAYVQSNMTAPLDASVAALEPYKSAVRKWVRLETRTTLGNVLRYKGYVVPGMLIVFVVVRGSAYEAHFLQQQSAKK